MLQNIRADMDMGGYGRFQWDVSINVNLKNADYSSDVVIKPLWQRHIIQFHHKLYYIYKEKEKKTQIYIYWIFIYKYIFSALFIL